MAKSKGPIPEGFHTVTPYLVVPGVARLIDFLKGHLMRRRRFEQHGRMVR